MMIDDQRLRLRIINDGWSRTTALVDNDNRFRPLRFHRRSLLFVMDISALADKVDIDERFLQPESRERAVDDNASVEAIGVLVRDDQGLFFCRRAR